MATWNEPMDDDDQEAKKNEYLRMFRDREITEDILYAHLKGMFPRAPIWDIEAMISEGYKGRKK